MARNKNPKKIFGPAIIFLFKAIFFICAAGILSFFSLFFFYAKDLPRPERFSERQIFQPTKIYDRTGQVLLYTIFGEEKREIVPLTQIPGSLKNAVIAAEDQNFYSHFGIDLKGILRAGLVNLRLKKPLQGGSTIPQQLIRSTFLTNEKTLQRKIREIILTLELDRRYDKDQILEWYLNQIPLGSNAYGVEAASQSFFSQPVAESSLAQSALLASLIRAPSRLSPHGQHLDELLQRKNYVLKRMLEEGYINETQRQLAQEEELKFAKPVTSIIAPHFVLYVQEELLKKYGEDFLKEKGLKVYTSLDVKLQELGEELIKKGVARNKNFRAYNAALVALNPQNNEILAMIGSADYFKEIEPPDCTPGKNCLFEPEFNVATLGQRQPGSAFKPVVYATAFSKGYTDSYIVTDELTNFGVWAGKEYIPRNYDNRFRGPVTLRSALAQSLNVPSVKVLMYLAGLAESLKTSRDLGITTLKDPSFYGPSLVLGGGEVTLLEMTSAYGVFANGGVRNKLVAILKIEDADNKILEENKKEPKRVLSREVAELITDILSDNKARAPSFGARSSLYIPDTRVAVKTGTTQFFNDAWTIGYGDEIVVGVWAGNNDNSSTHNKPGVVLAGPIWNEFISKALKIKD